MAELVAGALLTVVFEKLFERLASPEFRQNTPGYKLKRLEPKLKNASLYLADAENKQLSKKDIKEWLDSLKHLVFRVDDISEEIYDSENPSFVRKFLECLKSFFHCLPGTVRGELDEILMELDGLLERADRLGLQNSGVTAPYVGSSSTANLTPLLAQHRVFGREGDIDVILELLLSDKAFGTQQNVGTEIGELSQKRIGVVPIVGMGGIGKTTLAQRAYNDIQVESEFQKHRVWVTVSTEFNIDKILKSILKQIDSDAVGTEEPHLVQQKIKDALTGKKFLIVLDDVWDESYRNWNLLKSNFESGALGSRVVVTTRNENVGKMVTTGPIHMLKGVSRKDCWSIFIDHAFSGGDSDSYQWLHEIGRKIVEKCDGLPLAVMAMGGLLCSTRDPREWENVLNSPVWDISENNQGNEVLPSLWLSYRYLPSSVKQCFAYSSMFPQDYRFDKKEMILLWMAEGFLSSGNTETRSMEGLGEKYFDILVSRSLFQRSSRDDESKFIMHDLIHDLAAFVSGKFCVSVAKEDVELKSVTVQTRHLSLDDVSLDSKLLSGVSKAKHLRSFLSQKQKYRPGKFCDDEFVKQLITNHRSLRALTLGIKVPISASFRNLKHLRLLSLNYFDLKEVPSSVCTLFNLQTLILSECFLLTQLPTDITKLVKLRHLDIGRAEHIKHMPPHMGNLKELRTLNNFIVGDPNASAWSNIKEMQDLQHLSGTLRISGLENAAKFQDVGKDILRRKANLKELVLEWKEYQSSRREDKGVLDVLQPHTNLERLVIRGYQSALSFPIWVGDKLFEKLVSVELQGWRFCNSLPPLGQLPSLVKLVIGHFAKLEKIGVEFYGNDSSTSPFQCLKTLELRWMGMLKEWVFVNKAFPRLKKLTIRRCPDLPVSSIDCKMVEELEITEHSCLESFPLDKFPMLRELLLKSCSNLKSLTNYGNSESLTSSLTILEIKSCSKLIAPQTRLGLQYLTALVWLSISDCECESAAAASMSSELFAQVLLPNSLASLHFWDLKGFKSINGSAFQQAKSLKELTFFGCNELESLPEKELPRSLSTLKISYCSLLERKYHKSKGDQNCFSHIVTIVGNTTKELDQEE